MSQDVTPGGNAPDTASMGNGGYPDAGAGGGNNGGDSEFWYSSLPEDLRGDSNITKYKSAEELARGHVSAVSMLGRDKIPMPKSDAEYLDVYKRLGMPETKDDYKFEDAEYELPENIYPRQEQEADRVAFRGWAHELGLTQKQAAGLYDRFMKHQVGGMQSINRRVDVEMAKCNDVMRQTWGEATDANLVVANRAMVKFFGKDVADSVAASGLGRNFQFIQGMYNLGTRSLEELGIDKRGNSTRTPEQLQQEVGQLQAHPAYFDRNHPEHRQVNDQVLALLERLGKQG